jgi:hypothetical protein
VVFGRTRVVTTDVYAAVKGKGCTSIVRRVHAHADMRNSEVSKSEPIPTDFVREVLLNLPISQNGIAGNKRVALTSCVSQILANAKKKEAWWTPVSEGCVPKKFLSHI